MSLLLLFSGGAVAPVAPRVGAPFPGMAGGALFIGRGLGMANVHGSETFFIGDDIAIAGFLHNADGSAFDLTGSPSVEWKLIDATGAVIMTKTIGAGITIVGDPTTGEIMIPITQADSGALAAGIYRDQCRASNAAQGRSTQWVGEIVFKAAA